MPHALRRGVSRLVLAPACLLTCTLAAAAQPSPAVNVTGGAVRGYLAAPGAVFKAIPFAEPPVGALRWREPEPVKPWRGVRDATRYSAACMQSPLGTDAFIAPLARRYGASYPPHYWELSEDCLYLNVWTPSVGATSTNWPMSFSDRNTEGGMRCSWGTPCGYFPRVIQARFAEIIAV